MLHFDFIDTLQIHPTCLAAPQGGNIAHQLHTPYPSISFPFAFYCNLCDCMFVFYLTPPYSVSNIINMFHPCQSEPKTHLHQRPASIIHLKVMGWPRMGDWDKCVRVDSCKCVLDRDAVRRRSSDRDKGRDSGGGRLMEEQLSTTLRASVSQTESWSEISWFFTVSTAHYLGGEWGEEQSGAGWGSAFNLTRLICLPHLSGFYFLLLAEPLSNLFGQALTHDAGRRPEGHPAECQEKGRGSILPLCD